MSSQAANPVFMSQKEQASIELEKLNQLVKNRTNVITLGDHIRDGDMKLGMSNIQNSIDVGFLNYKVEDNLDNYVDKFDFVLVDDMSFDLVNQIVDYILAGSKNDQIQQANDSLNNSSLQDRSFSTITPSQTHSFLSKNLSSVTSPVAENPQPELIINKRKISPLPSTVARQQLGIGNRSMTSMRKIPPENPLSNRLQGLRNRRLNMSGNSNKSTSNKSSNGQHTSLSNSLDPLEPENHNNNNPPVSLIIPNTNLNNTNTLPKNSSTVSSKKSFTLSPSTSQVSGDHLRNRSKSPAGRRHLSKNRRSVDRLVNKIGSHSQTNNTIGMAKSSTTANTPLEGQHLAEEDNKLKTSLRSTQQGSSTLPRRRGFGSKNSARFSQNSGGSTGNNNSSENLSRNSTAPRTSSPIMNQSSNPAVGAHGSIQSTHTETSQIKMTNIRAAAGKSRIAPPSKSRFGFRK